MNVTAPLLLLLLTVCMASGALLPKALWQFGKMIQCVQPGVNPLDYNNYGCWCGFGGSGTPRDEVDLCCKIHDKCYKKSRKTPGCTAIADLPYIRVYDFTCSKQQVACSATNSKCQAAVCECDQVAAHCFAQATYNPENKNLDSKVHCAN
ncbi:phospholipase A2 isoform X1 [Xiphias gladius]|uniref:phospholipase A2 isoform X1 n=2 Tax=Xiphias gladius TaxID=8245 RepID=UPI001A99F402|nr:phospholipase A2 isoform X1 [Xiphias gladius]XP_040012079.1 phospholipase A2 isoform X1 [Xiphias gladius]